MHTDFYEMGNTSSRMILQKFKTYQQTTEYTCGPAALVMAAYYRGTLLNEMGVAEEAGTSVDTCTSTEQLVNYLEANGWKVRSSLTEPKIASLKFLRNKISKRNPVMVEWVDWDGHWQVVIGYDYMGTPDDESDDVIIMAAPLSHPYKGRFFHSPLPTTQTAKGVS
jgi:Peptidase_C39 like family